MVPVLVLVVLRVVVMVVARRRCKRLRLVLLAIVRYTLSRHMGMLAAAPTSSPAIAIFAVAALAAVRAATPVPLSGTLAVPLLFEFYDPDRQLVHLDFKVVVLPRGFRFDVVQLLC